MDIQYKKMLNMIVGSYFVFIGFYNGNEFITSGSDILPCIKIDICYFSSFPHLV